MTPRLHSMYPERTLSEAEAAVEGLNGRGGCEDHATALDSVTFTTFHKPLTE